ncbi:hypothetical protein PMI18_05361, partial [Pseudomonas sp. GM102]|uniref:hypothetical protein n=1 Tax=Pseudomonas sp. GM102 TaxID=1144321 RepID=UPI00026F66E3
MWKRISILLVLGVAGCSVQPTFTDIPPAPSIRAMTALSSPQQDDLQSISAAQPPVFKVVEAPAGELNADTLGTEANVQVSYPNLAPRDTVGVRLTGVALRDA